MLKMIKNLSTNETESTSLLLSESPSEDCPAQFVCIPMESVERDTPKKRCEDPSERSSEISSDSEYDRKIQDFLSLTNHSCDGQNKPRPKSFNVQENERELTLTTPKLRRTLSRFREHNVPDKYPYDSWAPAAKRIGSLNTKLLDAIEFHNNIEVESILEAGANPNATCRAGHISACHAAAYSNSDAFHLLLTHNADTDRKDKFGRTPLHLAAWAGNNWTIAMLLNFPTDLQYQVVMRVTPEAEEEIKKWWFQTKSLVEVPCELPLVFVLQQSWKDSIEHRCRRYMTCLPKFFSGWTPLHVASCAGHHHAAHLLLAAGANPNSKDAIGQTPLDIAGSGCFMDSCKVDVDSYVKTIEILVLYGGKLNTSESSPSNSALHTAVELGSVEAINILLAAGAPISHHNAKGNTPLHECVAKFDKNSLQVLAKHCSLKSQSVDVTNSSGYTVLHTAILASWIPGVCVALDAGADVTIEASDGRTAIHIAARNGNLDILDEILLNAGQYLEHDNKRAEPPVFCAVRSGNLDCVQTLIDAGASLKLTYYVEPNFDELTMEIYLLTLPEVNELNMILHATAAVGSVEMLEFFLNHDKSLEKLLEYRCDYLMNMIPVEFAAFHNKFSTFKFLLQKTVERAQVTQKNFDSSRLLSIIATLNYEDLFEEVINLIPDAVREATKNGNYPLHDAAKNGNRQLILQLINHGADLSETNKLGETAISLLTDNLSKPAEFLASIFDCYIETNHRTIHNSSACEITVDYRVLIPTSDSVEERSQMRVLTALLKTDNRKNQRKLLAHPLVESFLYLKWKTLSTYFYIMVFLYGLFVMSLSVYIVSVFFYKDKDRHVSYYFSPHIWQYVVYITLGVIIIQELSCTNLAEKTWALKIFSVEFWVKCCTYGCAIIIPQFITMSMESSSTEWRRHLATLALVMAWLNIMMLLSKTPMSGYYIQMFLKVSKKIVKILFTFLFLILMFSFCFMVQFHSHDPFEGPWAAIVKTLVMMTSEFDYGGTFTKQKAHLSNSIQILRVVFVIFLILAAIVLMNLMVGVAVHDVQHLVIDGNLRRLDKQVGFLNKLELCRGQKSFFHILGLYRWFSNKDVPQVVKIKPVNDSECCYKGRIKETLLNKVQENLENMDKKIESMRIEMKLENLIQIVKENKGNILEQISDLQSAVVQIRKTMSQNYSQLNLYADTRSEHI